MKKILSFMSYFQGSNRLSDKDSLYTLKYFLVIFFCSGASISLIVSLGLVPFTAFLGFVFLASTASIGITWGIKPSVLHLLPISYKRRILYYYASIALCSLFLLAVFFLLFMVTLFPIALLGLSEGDDTLFWWFTIPFLFGGKSYLFCGFRELFNVSILSIVARMKRMKSVLISFAALVLTNFFGQVILESLIDVNTLGYAGMVNICLYLDELPDPTLAVILSVALGVMAFIASFLFVVYQEKTKKER